MNKRILIFIGIIAVFFFGMIFFKNSEKTIPSETPKYRDINNSSYFLGKFKPSEIVMVQPEISGVVDSIYVSIGDTVLINDKIAKIRIVPIPEEIERTKKALELASTDLEQKKINHERNIFLFEKDAIAKSDLEKTALELDFAKIEYSNAVNNFNIAKRGFSKSANESPNIVKSNINGEVINILVKEGVNVTERNTFNDGSTIAIIMNADSYFFEFEITENEVSRMSQGDSLQITIKALNNKTIKARIDELRLTVNQGTYQYLVRAIPNDTLSKLRPGFTGLAEFEYERKKDVLSIKEKNIIYKNRKSYVEIIDDENSIVQVEIQTGISDGIYTEVISNLNINDKIKIQ